jgi:hypothetical protein
MEEINSVESLLRYVGKLSKQNINDYPEYAVNEWCENGDDILEMLSFAKKGEEFFKKILSLLNKSDYALNEARKFGNTMKNDVVLSVSSSTSYDYSNSPAWAYYKSKIEPIDAKVKEIEKMAKTTTTGIYDEASEQYVYPAIKSVSDVIKCTLK